MIYNLINLFGSFLTALITTGITNRVTYKRTLKTNRIEREEKKRMDDWIELQNLIKDIANSCSYMAEIAVAMVENKHLDDNKIYEHKKQVIDIHYELNYKLLMYMGVLKRMGVYYLNDLDYVDFYNRIFDTANKIKRAVFEFLDNKGSKDVHIECCADNELLSRIIRKSEQEIKKSESI